MYNENSILDVPFHTIVLYIFQNFHFKTNILLIFVACLIFFLMVRKKLS